MRFKITILLKRKNVLLPHDHQYFLSAYIYRTIESADPYYSLELHRPKKYKHFTFSYLMTKKRMNTDKGILVKDNEIYFFISSPDSRFLKTLVEGMLASPEIKIKNIKGVISEMKILQQPELDGKIRFRTLSPIVIKKSVGVRKFEGKKKIEWINLYPKDEEFSERLINNLKSRFSDYYGKDASDKHLNIKILNFKPKKHRIVNTYHRCALCDMIVEGDKELIKYGYEAGLGEKNAMGFGMVRVV
jgi:CRISPR-associated endoribonuclease Cas6